ncbi:MAG: O-antigen ligase family protein [Methylobacter sp.]|nr:O-antigen ligase family protein [Methylobacter sp.]
MAIIKESMFSYQLIAEKSLAACRYLAIIVAISAPISTAVASVASIAMLLTWIISGNVWSSLKIAAGQPAGKMLLVFFAWLVISSFYADTAWADKITTLSSWKKLFFTFVLLGFFYQEKWKNRFVHYYLFVMIIAAVIAVGTWLFDIYVRDASGPGIIMTNHTSQSLAFVVAVICCIFSFKEELSKQRKVYLTGIILLFIFNIFFVSQSRSGYIALPVAAFFMLVNIYGYKKIPHTLGILAVAIVLITLTSTTLQQRIKLAWEENKSSQTSENLTSIGVRDIFRQNTLELIKQKPIFGYGTSSFKTVYSEHAAAKYKDWRGESVSDPHNQYLFVWLENGLVGLLIFLAYIYIAIKQGATQKSYGIIAASVLVAFATTSLFNSHFKTFPEGHLLAFFVGCLLAQQPTIKDKKAGA